MMEDSWQKLIEDTEIVCKNNKYYIKYDPKSLYNTLEEAKKVQTAYRGIFID